MNNTTKTSLNVIDNLIDYWTNHNLRWKSTTNSS